MKFKVGDLVRIHKEKWKDKHSLIWIDIMDKYNKKVVRVYRVNESYTLVDCKHDKRIPCRWVESCLEKIPKGEEIAWLI